MQPKTPALEARPNITALSTLTFPSHSRQQEFCWSGQMGVSRYVAEISKVTAWQPGGRESIKAVVSSKVPHAMGKLSEHIPAFIDYTVGWSQGKDSS
jgi:hypothetical protein